MTYIRTNATIMAILLILLALPAGGASGDGARVYEGEGEIRCAYYLLLGGGECNGHPSTRVQLRFEGPVRITATFTWDALSMSSEELRGRIFSQGCDGSRNTGCLAEANGPSGLVVVEEVLAGGLPAATVTLAGIPQCRGAIFTIECDTWPRIILNQTYHYHIVVEPL